MKIKRICLLAFLFLAPGVTPRAHGESPWRAKAQLNVEGPGIVEAVLPPELHAMTARHDLDLELIGPDGRLRTFELYWREPVGRASVELAPVEFKFEGKGRFFWEGKTDQKLQADRIHIEIPEGPFVGQVDIEALGPDGWTMLKKNEAVFRAPGQFRADMEIKKNIYQSIRLRFTGFDKKYKKEFFPMGKVRLSGERPGKDYARSALTPEFQGSELDGIVELKTILPGSGLWIRSLNLATQAQFQGEWRLGAEKIQAGIPTFVALCQGNITHVSKDRQTLSFDVNRAWPSRSLILKLNPKGKYIGEVSDFTVKVRLLRMVFSADAQGMYTAISGTGKKEAIYETPADKNRSIDHAVEFSAPESNRGWLPENLVEKYKIMGGPFKDKGFSWQSEVMLSEPGYYRMGLNMAASLEKNRSAIRLVKDNTQIPFFFGGSENREADLIGSTNVEYDPDRNTTTLTVQLPLASKHWSDLGLYTSGIFTRQVRVEIPKPGNMGWRKWMTRQWTHRQPDETQFGIDLDVYPEGLDRIRFIIPHGNNQPIKISRIRARYTAPHIHFIAREKGPYRLYGGSRDAQPPDYDLSLVQSSLLEELPHVIKMQELETFHSQSWKAALDHAFKDQGWGLYAALGLVTVALLFIIVRLFPKVKV